MFFNPSLCMLFFFCCCAIPIHAQFARVSIVEVRPTSVNPAGDPAAECIVLRNLESRTIELDGWFIRSNSRKLALDGLELPAGGRLYLTTKSGLSMFESVEAYALTRSTLVTDSEWAIALCAPSGELVSFVSSAEVGWVLSKHRGFSVVAGQAVRRFSPGACWQLVGAPMQEAQPCVDSVRLESAYFTSPSRLLLRFSSPMDSLLLFNPAIYSFPSSKVVVRGVSHSDWFREVVLEVDPAVNFDGGGLFLEADLYDMEGAPLVQRRKPIFLLDTLFAPGLRVNEILLENRSGGARFLELWNTGGRVIDLSRVSFAVQGSNALSVSKRPHLLEPGDFAVLTQYPDRVLFAHPSCPPSTLLKVSRLPAFMTPRDAVLLYNALGVCVDSVDFSCEDLYPLARGASGFSLERRRREAVGRDGVEWGTARFSAGGATPGLPNSIWSLGEEELDSQLEIYAKYLPGRIEFSVELPVSGHLSLGICTLRGRVVALFNEILSEAGVCGFSWAGRDLDGQRTTERNLVIFAVVELQDGRIERCSSVFLNPFAPR